MSFGGTNLDQGHAYNRRLVLEAIRVHGALSRAELTRLTGLAPQTISNISAALTEVGLVVAERRSGNGRGQPPADLRLNPKGGYAFGVSIDNRRIFTVLVDIAGNLLDELEDRLYDTSPESVLPRIASSITTLRKQTPLPVDRILGAGIAMTGLTTHGNFVGLAFDDFTSHWYGFPFERQLEPMLGIPIFTDNDARAAAIGEAFYGKGRKFRDFVYIYFGVGIGGSIINSGQPFRGSRGRASEFGHMIVEAGGRLCSCGNRGCLEQYTSMVSALRAIEHRADNANTQEALLRAFDDGDPRILHWIDSAAIHLTTAIINLENIFDPETILLGGIIPEPLLDAIMARIEPLPRSVASRREDGASRIVKSSIGPAIPALGAASLALFDATSASFSLLFKKNVVSSVPAAIDRFQPASVARP
ncbi:ROK family transcriptional regulator [Mesorhizobium comanense]|uniref:ROK family transcriptional regulator n=1 Tax=Mesorhizobium comanense TaxID=2502215 RepID=UPI0010F69DA6|nr:ROK family transcriptional regulator [Mesorhizobium comanense]